MRTVICGTTFIRAFKRTIKKHPSFQKEVKEKLKLLAENPFSPDLRTHKLKGKLSGTWACSAGYDLRIIFDFIKNDFGKEDDIFLIEIGTHEEVY